MVVTKFHPNFLKSSNFTRGDNLIFNEESIHEVSRQYLNGHNTHRQAETNMQNVWGHSDISLFFSPSMSKCQLSKRPFDFYGEGRKKNSRTQFFQKKYPGQGKFYFRSLTACLCRVQQPLSFKINKSIFTFPHLDSFFL